MFLASEKRSSIETAVAVLIQVFPRVMGLMFVYAGYLKVMDHARLLVVLEFDGFPVSTVKAVAWTVIGSELLLGAMLIFLRPRPWLMVTAGVVLIVYSVQLAFLLASTDAPPCGCMEYEAALRFRANEDQTNRMGLIRNIVLMAATFLTWLQLPLAARPQPQGFDVVQPKENP